MNPILRNGDIMLVVPYGGGKICTGDVVVFIPPDQKQRVVHRVVSFDSQGVVTRGDSTANVDPWALNPCEIIGRVVSIERRGRNLSIAGGVQGRMLTRILLLGKRADLAVSRILRPAYRRLARSKISRSMLSRLVKTRVLCYKRPNGIEMQLLMGHRVIGNYLPGRKQWRICRPFHLFVDEMSLPRI